MKPSLRIINDGSAGTEFNMAADLHLFETCSSVSTIYVRFYEWNPASITLGYMQKPAEILDLDACARDGIRWIRRVTGGRAVLHKEDLTYSCIFPTHLTMMGASVAETYALISRCLAHGLEEFGIPCTGHDTALDTAQARREVKLPCFLTPNRDEVMVENKKLIGSAQKRSKDAVLQHGSIPLTDAFHALADYSRIDDRQKTVQKKLFRKKCTCIRDHICDATSGALTDALARGFSCALGLAPQHQPWSKNENATIMRYMNTEEFRHTWCQ